MFDGRGERILKTTRTARDRPDIRTLTAPAERTANVSIKARPLQTAIDPRGTTLAPGGLRAVGYFRPPSRTRTLSTKARDAVVTAP